MSWAGETAFAPGGGNFSFGGSIAEVWSSAAR